MNILHIYTYKLNQTSKYPFPVEFHDLLNASMRVIQNMGMAMMMMVIVMVFVIIMVIFIISLFVVIVMMIFDGMIVNPINKIRLS